MRTADVVVNIKAKTVAQVYTYRLPEALSFLEEGWRVRIPFGARQAEGFILQTRVEADDVKYKYPLRDIITAIDEEAWFTPTSLRLARWMHSLYLCNLADAMRLFMPGGSALRIVATYCVEKTQAESETAQLLCMVKSYQRVWEYLTQKDEASLAELKKALPDLVEQLPDILAKFCRAKLLYKSYGAQKKAVMLQKRWAKLARPVNDEVCTRYAKKKSVLRLLKTLEAGEKSVADLRAAGFSYPTLNFAASAGDIIFFQKQILRDSYATQIAEEEALPPLNQAQAKAWEVLQASLQKEKYQGFLLQGVTGSGKTRVYIEAAREVRRKGKKVMMLVPEIALTDQVVRLFKSVFPEDIVVLHSRLSVSERNDAITRVRTGQAGIIIGARSALFIPTENIGLIVLDEEQDSAYKQDNRAPRYHARSVATALAQIEGATLILGSATPSLETAYRAEHGALQRLLLPERVHGAPLPTVTCVDMREELKKGNRSILSFAMQKLLQTTLERGEQMILLLNRRGFSTFVMCRACGKALLCPHCQMPLVYHRNGTLRCHHCDMQESVPKVCPHCGSRYIKYFGTGTEQLEEALQKLVPTAKIARMDADTMTQKFAHQKVLTAFRNGDYDILLGTQMVAKGHDIPNVTAVGILSADGGLRMPDFRAAERCFMLIAQAAGRAGRGRAEGHVLVQCYDPEHYAIQAAMLQDYDAFYQQELKKRQELYYPPFRRLIKLLFMHEDEAQAKAAAEAMKEKCMKQFANVADQEILGPAPALIEKMQGVYRYVLLWKIADLQQALKFLQAQGVERDAQMIVDVDPSMTL